ncbi:MAG: serine hydrolase [Candidatus Taylorbacteria bacterium]|nr:serine hydrolase [Candidatus Taylorbacteria bacterium]
MKTHEQNNTESPTTTWKLLALIFFFVSVSLAVWGWPAITGRLSNVGFSNPYPLIDPARSFTPQEHFIVNLQPLREELRELVQKEGPGSVSLYFEFLNTGANINIGQEVRIWPASLSKLPLAMAVMKKVEDGAWQLDTELVLKEEEKDAEFGALFQNPAGTTFTVERLLQELLTNSDNTAYHIFLENMNPPELDSIIIETGLEELFDKKGWFSAKEYSRLWRALYTSSFLKRGNSTRILKWLSETDFDEYLASGIDKNILFAHKWGRNQNYRVFLDSGIVYIPNRPYIITVMIRGDGSAGEEGRATMILQNIGSTVYNYIISYTN